MVPTAKVWKTCDQTEQYTLQWNTPRQSRRTVDGKVRTPSERQLPS